ncbi:MAG: T9SS type A sorting domain-containing protein [Bacteroidales bacterium]
MKTTLNFLLFLTLSTGLFTKIATAQNTVSMGVNSISIGITVATAQPGLAISATKAYDILTVTDVSPANEISLSADTNTISDNLTLNISANPAAQYSVRLSDVNGMLLLENETTGNTTQLSMVSFPPSIYLLKVLQNNNEIRTFRIIKN